MTDERRDDEILGRALARAIETIDVNETPFERSPVMARTLPRTGWPWMRLAGAVGAAALAVGVVTTLTYLRATREAPAVSSPSAVPSLSPTPAATATPVAVDPNRDRIGVYFARDGLPPMSAVVTGVMTDGSPEARIISRLNVLQHLRADQVPAGLSNPLAFVAPPQGGQGSFGLSTRVQGDVATVEFDIPTGWGVRGSASSQALLQQLVYVITEEPGVHRALIKEKGKPNAVIDQLIVDRPLSREDVFGYAGPAHPDKIEDPGTGGLADIVDWRASVDEVVPGLGRFVVELNPQTASSSPPIPRFTAELVRPNQEKSIDEGKWWIRVTLADAVWVQPAGQAFHCCPLRAIGKTPIRSVSAYPLTTDPPGPRGDYRGVGFDVILDDARPWRASVLQNPLRLVIDIGGPIQATSDSVAVYSPRAGDTTGRTQTVSGFARAFEANVAWRLRDSTGRIVASGNTTATIGTSAVWGSFQTTVTIPASVSGNVTLEVFWPSPKDGADVGLVRVPLAVR